MVRTTTLLILFLVTTAQAGGVPPHLKEYSKSAGDAGTLARQSKYKEAQGPLKAYVGKYQADPKAKRQVDQARQGLARLATLDSLWTRAQATPATEARKYAAALLEKRPAIYPAMEEKMQAFELMRDHDQAFGALIAERFPMSIRVKWLEPGDHSEYEGLYLDGLTVASEKAKIPIRREKGKWSIEHDLRFKKLSSGMMGTRVLSIDLGGPFRLKDGTGKLRESWVVGKPGLHVEEHKARQSAANKLGQALVDKMIGWLLEQ